MKPNPLTLIIDDERANQLLLRRLLEAHGYRVSAAASGATGILQAAARRQNVIILELDLPDMNGLTVLERLRQWCRVPVLVLSARRAEADVVAALDCGADDYMTKPFGAAELMARLRVLLREVPGAPHRPQLVEGNWTINLATHAVTYKRRKIRFTATEEALFYTLVQNAGRVVTRSHLLDSVWGRNGENEMHCLCTYITSLRKKLHVCDGHIAIQSEGGLGYRLILNPASDRVGQPIKSRPQTSARASRSFINGSARGASHFLASP